MSGTGELPKAWTYDIRRWGERQAALAALPEAQRRALGLEWVRAAVGDARRVLPVWEAEYPDDSRPREAIEAAERVIVGDAGIHAVLAANTAVAASASASGARVPHAARAAFRLHRRGQRSGT